MPPAARRMPSPMTSSQRELGEEDVGYEAEDADIEFSLQNADYHTRNAVD